MSLAFNEIPFLFNETVFFYLNFSMIIMSYTRYPSF